MCVCVRWVPFAQENTWKRGVWRYTPAAKSAENFRPPTPPGVTAFLTHDSDEVMQARAQRGTMVPEERLALVAAARSFRSGTPAPDRPAAGHRRALRRRRTGFLETAGRKPDLPWSAVAPGRMRIVRISQSARTLWKARFSWYY